MQYYNMTKDKAVKEAKRIMKAVDINNNGEIDFTEFVISNVAANDILTDEKLLSAFNMLDMDGNGKITIDDLR